MTKPLKEPIYVSQPSLPNLNRVITGLGDLWESYILTNSGKKHRELERLISKKLKVDYCSLFCNGTLALQTAIHILGLEGEVITTPFTFAATPHVLTISGITPVFCDIEPETCNIDPFKIEELITEKTTGILPVHTYGNPCDVITIDEYRNKGLKILYDAAPCFGVERNEIGIGNFGDLSIFSFHATKVFNTFEGGCIVTNDKELKKKIDLFKNFGYSSPEKVVCPGINGKMNEFQAIIGIENLRIFDIEIEKRKLLFKHYEEQLSLIEGIRIIKTFKTVKYNYAYLPIVIDEKKFGVNRNKLYKKLKDNNVFTRKYFYPLCSNYICYKELPSADHKNLKNANWIADRVLCLPLYSNLSENVIDYICEIINSLRK